MKARRFFLTLLLVTALAVLIDYGIGIAGSMLLEHAKGGDTARHHYINQKSSEDILVFGSSRAIHHYDPRILEDRLGMTAYNCGADGEGILLHYMQLSNILMRYKPKVIILDLYDEFDYLREPDMSKYLFWERSYYGRGNAALDSVFHAVDAAEKFKMLSNAYRYNYRFLQMLSDNIHPYTADIKGYRPNEGELPGVFNGSPSQRTGEIEPLKVEYIRRFAEKCHDNGISLIVVASPFYHGSKDDQFPEPVRSILDTYGATMLDFSNDPEFVGQRKYFHDTNHLQTAGAQRFSVIIAEAVDSIQHADNQNNKK